MTGEKFSKDNFEDSLRDGVLLCKLMNTLRPGFVQKVNVSGGDYKMLDNISQFQKAAQAYGVAEVDLFNANDLWEQKNIAVVTQTIFAVARAVSEILNFFSNEKRDDWNYFLFSSAINIRNFADHFWVHVHHKKIIVNSLKNSWELERLSLDFKLELTKVQIKLDRISEHREKLFWENKLFKLLTLKSN